MWWYVLACLTIPVLWGWGVYRLTATVFLRRRRRDADQESLADFQI
ncbi:MAG: hypothetical protein KDA85_16245 [Planctomycetaceae bacterium]|nr:hypothetical protein [Planctomycetaceae bacterium]